MASLFSTNQLVAEVTRGEGLTLPDLARALPSSRGKGRLNPSTIYRWATSGIRLPSGGHLQLEALKLGKWLLSSRAALERFLATQQEVAPDQAAPAAATASPGSSNRRRAELADAKAEAGRLGLT
jgi:hypothetical protein